MGWESFCRNIYSEPKIARALGGDAALMMVVFAGCYVVTSNVMLYLYYINTKRAENADLAAVSRAIFPIYKWILVAQWFINSYIGILLYFYVPPAFGIYWDQAAPYGIMYGIQHAMVEGVGMLFLQKGLGYNSVYTTCVYASIWGIISVTVEMVALSGTGYLRSLLLLSWYCVMLGFYGALYFAPKEKLFRRPAAYQYARFWFVYRLAIVIFFIFTVSEVEATTTKCINTFIRFGLFALFQPLVTYRALIEDSEWWQGCLDFEEDDEEYLADTYSSSSHTKSSDSSVVSSAHNTMTNDDGTVNAKSTSKSNRSNAIRKGIKAPMLGLSVNFNAAQTLAHTMDIMHSENGVKLLNFAYIKLSTDKLLGEGSFSRVYFGTYKKRECAVKLIFTADLTVDEIQRVAAESQILSSLKHPNIIEILGVSVLPPSVCILLELCKYGSLSDVLRKGRAGKKLLNITYLDLLSLAVGCCRGLTALHSKGEDVCHRDIKSFNFLVDKHLNAKVADLELGIGEDRNARVLDDILPNWAAPELIANTQSRQNYPVQAGDVYSFALVLWEIVSGRIPFEEYEDDRELRRLIVGGLRPQIDCFYPTAANSSTGSNASERHNQYRQSLTSSTNPSTNPMHSAPVSSDPGKAPGPVLCNTWDPRLLNLIQWGWHENPMIRPTMKEMCVALEELLWCSVIDHAGIHLSELSIAKYQKDQKIKSKNNSTTPITNGATSESEVSFEERPDIINKSTIPTTSISMELEGFAKHYTSKKEAAPAPETEIANLEPMIVPPADTMWCMYSTSAPHTMVNCSSSYRSEFYVESHTRTLTLLDLLNCTNTRNGVMGLSSKSRSTTPAVASPDSSSISAVSTTNAPSNKTSAYILNENNKQFSKILKQVQRADRSHEVNIRIRSNRSTADTGDSYCKSVVYNEYMDIRIDHGAEVSTNSSLRNSASSLWVGLNPAMHAVVTLICNNCHNQRNGPNRVKSGTIQTGNNRNSTATNPIQQQYSVHAFDIPVHDTTKVGGCDRVLLCFYSRLMVPMPKMLVPTPALDIYHHYNTLNRPNLKDGDSMVVGFNATPYNSPDDNMDTPSGAETDQDGANILDCRLTDEDVVDIEDIEDYNFIAAAESSSTVNSIFRSLSSIPKHRTTFSFGSHSIVSRESNASSGVRVHQEGHVRSFTNKGPNMKLHSLSSTNNRNSNSNQDTNPPTAHDNDIV